MGCVESRDNFGYEPLERVESTQKHGYYVSSWPWGYRASVLHYVKVTEKEKGRPPYIVEVAQTMKRNSNWPIPATPVVTMACYDLFRNDELMCDTECHRVSVDRKYQRTQENQTEFELFSDRYMRRFSNYQLVDRLRFSPGPNTPVVNLN